MFLLFALVKLVYFFSKVFRKLFGCGMLALSSETKVQSLLEFLYYFCDCMLVSREIFWINHDATIGNVVSHASKLVDECDFCCAEL